MLYFLRYNEILVENRDFSYSVALDAPVRGSLSKYHQTVWCANKL